MKVNDRGECLANSLKVHLRQQICHHLSNRVDNSTSSALVDTNVMLSPNSSLEGIRPDEIHEDAELLYWREVGRISVRRCVELIDYQVHDVTEPFFRNTIDGPGEK